MNLVYVLTGISGRISRLSFWLASIALLALGVGVEYAMGERWGSIAGLVLAYPLLAVLAKRGHDRNVPTWVPALFVAVNVAFELAVLFGKINLNAPETWPWPIFVVAFLVAIATLILIVDFGFRRGTHGPNRYGPDPLATHN
jgi:uncharacterized membrane protein YhaH (DUF805 family)